MSIEYEESILRSLRKITRAIDLYSHQLARQFKLTGPQIVCLRQLHRDGTTAPGQLAKEVSLSQATITGILDRLESRGLVERERSTEDRRRVIVRLTAEGSALAESAPSPLQERFATKLAGLPRENRAVIDTVLGQIVTMMEAEELDAAPVLQAGSILDGPTKPA
jgi:DNA-binding MarR family transcriptional regulator